MSDVSDDRWTCPACGETTVWAGATPEWVEHWRTQVQLDHREQHAAEPVGAR